MIGVGALLVLAALGGGVVASAIDDEDDSAQLVTVPSATPTGFGAGDGGVAQDLGRRARPDQVLEVDGDNRPFSDLELSRVVGAALEAAGGGRVTDVDRSDDPGEVYEVEVVRRGFEVDLALDGDLRRVPNERYGD